MVRKIFDLYPLAFAALCFTLGWFVSQCSIREAEVCVDVQRKLNTCDSLKFRAEIESAKCRIEFDPEFRKAEIKRLEDRLRLYDGIANAP